MVKIHISYTPDDEATKAQIVTLLEGILPPVKIKNTPGKPPYNSVYFIPKNHGKPYEIARFGLDPHPPYVV